MPPSLRPWSLVLLPLLLAAPVASAEEEARRQAAQAVRPSKRSRLLKTLVPIPGGERLRKDAALAFQKMHDEASAEGIWLWAVSGHRSRAEQRYLYRLYRKGLGPRAARPGRSNHQRGTAVDVSVGGVSSPVYGWLSANACRFGFRRTVRSEPWHWEYRPRGTPQPKPGQACVDRYVPPPLPPASPEVATPSPS
ncbi:D-alanyl-D-alanine carboxypeptidase [Stigmatella aurantiaca]|uniref:D-alanyl-D-alanine carboxypeptidase n=1 Tax=Stigmatella aurantiaca TaxID=41 RepID=A0A1H7UHI7_STIAU|nr:M15 family metallopeptidase [Stigmatella aurantiaca]SEL96431.1 D-alanyl-D-alanine carboxypeptidase [Stigmatella aurantiaca]